MHLDDGCVERAYAVLQGYACVGVGSGVEHYAVAGEACLLHHDDELALYVALKIAELHIGISRAERL